MNHLTFETFEFGDSGPLQVALAAALYYAANPKGWLVMFGAAHEMKRRHLAEAVAASIRNAGAAVLSVDARETEIDASALAKAKVLVVHNLEHLRHERSLDAVWAELVVLFGHRYDHQLPTVVTSPLALDRHNDWLVSRLLDRRSNVVVRMEGMSGMSAGRASDYRRNGP